MTHTMHAWYAVRVRSRCEKSAAEYLQGKGLEVCSAVAAQRRVWSDRVQIVETPLFPGYIFSRFNRLDRVEVLKVPGVVGIVGFGPVDCRVDESEMRDLQLLLASGAVLRTTSFIKVGSRVRVRGGAFSGATGFLQQFKNGHRLVVSIGLLQRSVAVELDEVMIEALPMVQIDAMRTVQMEGAV